MPDRRPVAPPSIRQRVIGAAVLVSFFGAVIVAAAVAVVVGDEVDELMDHSLRESAEIIHNVLVAQRALDHEGQVADDGGAYESDLVWQVIDTSQARVLNRSHRAPDQPLIVAQLPGTGGISMGPWRVVTIGFRQHPNRFLAVAQHQSERAEARGEVLTWAAGIAMGLVLVIGGVLNWRLRRELKPIDQLSRAVRRYDPLHPSTFSEDAVRAELLPVQEAVQELGRRLGQRIVSERAFTHHAAHALRTPLAGIEAQLCAVLSEVPAEARPRIERARQATRRLGRVMQALMMMFRSGIEPRRSPVTLQDLITTDLFETLRLRLQGLAPLHADPDLMTAVLLNLLDNAQRHGARQVLLKAEALPDGQCRLTVQDDGHGCPSELRARLRKALAEQDYNPRTGLKGLGLILADLVVRSHGGAVVLPEVSQGFAVVMTWPVEASHP